MEVAVDVMRGYDSDQEPTLAVLSDLQQEISVRAGEISDPKSSKRQHGEQHTLRHDEYGRGGPASERDDPIPRQDSFRQTPDRRAPADERYSLKDGRISENGRAQDSTPSGHEHHRHDDSHHEHASHEHCQLCLGGRILSHTHDPIYHPSNRRYGARSPAKYEEDSLMPHRPRGEVDEWAAMLQVQDQASAQGAQAYEASRKAAQRQYMESLTNQLQDKKRREEIEREEKRRELELQDQQIAALKQAEDEEKRRAAEEAAKQRSMFHQQQEHRNRGLEQQRVKQQAQDQAFLRRIQEEEDEGKRREEKERMARNRNMQQQRQAVEDQIELKKRQLKAERLTDQEYATKYAEMLEESDRRRREIEDKRHERIGRLEMMGNDNAEKERQLRMEEDERFLEQLRRKEAEAEAREKARRDMDRRAKEEYRGVLGESMERRALQKQQERERAARASQAELERATKEGREKEVRRLQEKQERQEQYRAELERQMREQEEHKRHWYRMSEKERMLNFQPLEAYVERQLGRGSEHGDSLQPSMYDFSYAEAFRRIDSKDTRACSNTHSQRGDSHRHSLDSNQRTSTNQRYVDNLSTKRGDILPGGRTHLNLDHSPPVPQKNFNGSVSKFGAGRGEGVPSPCSNSARRNFFGAS